MHEWFIKRQYKGIDPYQLDEKAFGIIKKIPCLGYLRGMLKPFHSRIPDSIFSKLPPIHHPKAIALMISANSKLFEITQESSLLEENIRLVKLLYSLRNTDYENACWGHPFEWGQSPRYPKNAPLVCVQAPIAHSLIDFYDIYKDNNTLKLIESSTKYLLYEAKKDYCDKHCSFRNSPYDKMHVHNSNIMAASLFYKYNTIIEDEAIINLADKLIEYTIRSQNSEGSWCYSTSICTIDNRHTGFILRAMLEISKIDQNPKLKDSLDKGLNFYKNKLFDGSLPKWSPNQTYPIDIHDVAQSIITFVEAGDLKFADSIADFAVANMSNGFDEFFYKLFEDGRKNRAVFIRWGQAWMMSALTMFLKYSFYQNSTDVEQ